jgi:hypothetical protein
MYGHQRSNRQILLNHSHPSTFRIVNFPAYQQQFRMPYIKPTYKPLHYVSVMLAKDKVSSPPKTSETVTVLIRYPQDCLLGAFAQSRKASITSWPSIHMNKRGYHRADFHEITHWGLPWICWENPNLVKIGQKYRELYIRPKNVLLLPVTPSRYNNGLFERYGTRLTTAKKV